MIVLAVLVLGAALLVATINSRGGGVDWLLWVATVVRHPDRAGAAAFRNSLSVLASGCNMPED